MKFIQYWLIRGSWKTALWTFLGILGLSLPVLQALEFFFADASWFLFIKSHGWWPYVLAIVFMVIIQLLRQSKFPGARIQGTDVLIEVRIGDIFDFPGAIVVGCNTTFDTSIEDDTIAADSIQGQFTGRYFASVSELDDKLRRGLGQLQKVTTRLRKNKPYGNLDEYQYGATIPVDTASRKGYFVALTQLNEHRTAQVEDTRFLELLPVMWNQIREKGRKEDLLCPILGSGRARLKLKKEHLLQMIVRSFVAATQEGRFTDKMTIVIHPSDFHQANLNLQELARFLECVCSYSTTQYKKVDGNPVGTEL